MQDLAIWRARGLGEAQQPTSAPKPIKLGYAWGSVLMRGQELRAIGEANMQNAQQKFSKMLILLHKGVLAA